MANQIILVLNSALFFPSEQFNKNTDTQIGHEIFRKTTRNSKFEKPRPRNVGVWWEFDWIYGSKSNSNCEFDILDKLVQNFDIKIFEINLNNFYLIKQNAINLHNIIIIMKINKFHIKKEVCLSFSIPFVNGIYLCIVFFGNWFGMMCWVPTLGVVFFMGSLLGCYPVTHSNINYHRILS